MNWNASQQANKRIKETLGDTSKYFAMLKVGNATYNWTVDSIGRWTPIGAAPSHVLAEILLKVEDIRQEVYAKLAGDQSLADKICQVPNYEEYIFYKESPGGEPEIAITGWGFHNFKQAGSFDTIKWPPLPAKHTTTITFSIDGRPQPGRAFSIVTPKMRKPYTTDTEGKWMHSDFSGRSFNIIDDLTQRQFTLTTADTDQQLDFDVTESVSLTVKATNDGQPISGETVGIDYAGRHYDLPLTNGQGTLPSIPLVSSDMCQATLRGEKRSIQLSNTTPNEISFDFVTPPPVTTGTGPSTTPETEEPEEPVEDKCSLTVVATLDGNPICGETVTVIYSGNHYDMVLQADGKATVNDIVCTGENCYAKLPACTEKGKAHQEAEADKVLVKDEENIITFELQSEAPPAEMVIVTVNDSNGIPMKDASFVLTQGPERIEGKLDDMGTTTFDRKPFITERPVTLSIITADNRQIDDINFHLDADENQYVLQENSSQEGNRLLEILAAIVLLGGLALLLIYAFLPGISELTKIINKNIF